MSKKVDRSKLKKSKFTEKTAHQEVTEQQLDDMHLKSENQTDSDLEEEKVPDLDTIKEEKSDDDQIDSTVHDLGDIMIQAHTHIDGDLNEKIGELFSKKEDEAEIEQLTGMGVNNNKNVSAKVAEPDSDNEENSKASKLEKLRELIPEEEHNKNRDRLEQIKMQREMAARRKAEEDEAAAERKRKQQEILQAMQEKQNQKGKKGGGKKKNR